MPKFRTKAGRLTRYAIHCGYVEKKISGPVETTLWHEGGPLYHVRQHNFETHTRIFWESFETLTEARKLLDKQAGYAYPTRQRS